jgi:hypothetical protein
MHIKVVGGRGERAGEGQAREQRGEETMIWGVGGGAMGILSGRKF